MTFLGHKYCGKGRSHGISCQWKSRDEKPVLYLGYVDCTELRCYNAKLAVNAVSSTSGF